MKKIKRCYDLIEEGNESLSASRWFSAAQSMEAVFGLLREQSTHLDETSVSIFPAIKAELVGQQQQLSARLQEEWNQNVSVVVKDDTKKKLVTYSILLRETKDEARRQAILNGNICTHYSYLYMSEVAIDWRANWRPFCLIC